MAHRLERRAVRGAGHAAGRGVRALPGAALLLTLGLAAARPGAGLAQAPDAGGSALAGSALPDLESWCGELGRPGWAPGVSLAEAYPATLAGHAIGGWGFEAAGHAPLGLAWPGVAAARVPVAWYDSVAVTTGGLGAWWGFGAPLAVGRGLRRAGAGPRARSVYVLTSGDFGHDGSALAIDRGDSLSWLRAETMSATRGAVGPLGASGRHLWGASGAARRGAHQLEGSFAQRGTGAELRQGVAGQAAGGESGRLTYRSGSAARWLMLSLARGHDHHESFGELIPFSRREAEEVRAAAEAGTTRDRSAYAVRLEWRRERVRRSADPAFDRRADARWAALRIERPAGEGRLRLELGAGRHDALGPWTVAPAVTYRFATSAFEGRVTAERLLNPVWADLAPGQPAFLQRTWAGGIEAGATSGGSRARAALLVGVTRDRALIYRLPLEDLWLRDGALADPGRYAFGLLTLSATWRARWLGAGIEGFGLVRERSPLEPEVDPGQGLRMLAETRFRLFHGDLGVTLRAEGEGVGARESEGLTPGRLPGYLSAGATVLLVLGDAVIAVRARNLEDRRRPETWTDPVTLSDALGPGREMRMVLTWRLFN